MQREDTMALIDQINALSNPALRQAALIAYGMTGNNSNALGMLAGVLAHDVSLAEPRYSTAVADPWGRNFRNRMSNTPSKCGPACLMVI
jgi:hypothetical protein